MKESRKEEEPLEVIGLPCKIARDNHVAAAFLNGPDFISFVRGGYPDSLEHGTDEIHRMFETIRIHRDTGLRFKCLSHESYDGQDVEYTLFDPHIVTKDRRKMEVYSVDLVEKLFMTPEGEISFSAISLEHP